MTRALLVTRYLCARLCIATRATAQTTPLPVSPDGWVVLPVDEYRALRERANPQPPQPAAPPVDATLTRVDYDLRVENDTVAGRALLTIDVLRDGWTRVQIPAGLMVRDARLDGQPVLARRGAAAARAALARRPRRAHARHRARRSRRRREPSRLRCPPRRRRSRARCWRCRAAASICRSPAASSPTASRPPARADGRRSAGRISR